MIRGSLFSGIGGFDLAAEWMGWENAFHCEWEEFPRKVLSYHFPNAKSYGDIKETDFTIWRGRIDTLSGGFPCQPFSQAGKRKGTEDDRYLWHEMLRAIQEISPRWIVGENVRGLVNWNGGMVFDQVCSDLEGEGYKVFPLLLPAAAVSAPHRRDRIWFVAFKDAEQNGWGGYFGQEESKERRQRNTSAGDNERVRPNYGEIGITPDTDGAKQTDRLGENREEKREIRGDEERDVPRELLGDGVTPDTACIGHAREEYGEKSRGFDSQKNTGFWFQHFPTQSPVCGGDDGIPRELDSITFPKWRNESIKAYGNAIVPQVAYEIFKTIDRYETTV